MRNREGNEELNINIYFQDRSIGDICPTFYDQQNVHSHALQRRNRLFINQIPDPVSRSKSFLGFTMIDLIKRLEISVKERRLRRQAKAWKAGATEWHRYYLFSRRSFCIGLQPVWCFLVPSFEYAVTLLFARGEALLMFYKNQRWIKLYVVEKHGLIQKR